MAYSRRSLLAPVVGLLLLNCLAVHHKSEALVLEEEFAGQIVTDLKVNLRADEVWAVYRRPDYYKILSKFVAGYYQSIDYVTGKGGVGSIVNITITPAYGGPNWLFKIIEINHKTRTRVERHLNGGYFDSGFTSFETIYTVIKSKNDSCIIRQTTAFKIQQKSLSNATAARVELNWFNSVVVADLSNKRLVALNEEYSGNVETEMKVNLPAADVWNVFRSKDFGHILRKLMPDYYKQIQYVTGDGRVGTVLNVTLQAESAAGSTNWPGSLNWLEKIINIDDKTMTRRVRQLQGYHLDNGLVQFETVHRTIPKAGSSCVIETVTPFKVKSAFSSFASATNVPSWTTAMKIANYVNSMKIKG